MSKITGKGTPKKRKYSETDKIKVLLILESNDFNYSQTVREEGISISSLQRWDKELGPSVYGTIKPTMSIALRLANQVAIRQITQEQIRTMRANVTFVSLEELYRRSQGIYTGECVERTEDLIKMSNIFKEEPTKEPLGGGPQQNAQNVRDLWKAWEDDKKKTIILNADDAQVVG